MSDLQWRCLLVLFSLVMAFGVCVFAHSLTVAQRRLQRFRNIKPPPQ